MRRRRRGRRRGRGGGGGGEEKEEEDGGGGGGLGDEDEEEEEGLGGGGLGGGGGEEGGGGCYKEITVITNATTRDVIKARLRPCMSRWPCLCPECTIRFFSKKGLKNALYTNVFQTKVVTNHNPPLLV